MHVNAYAASSATSPLEPTTIERRDVGPKDVLIDIAYAGICHSDIHTIRGEWGDVPYPLTVGHEIVGTVAEVGADVTCHKVGDRVGVGCMVNSCRECENCLAGEEQYCLKGNIGTYGAKDVDGTITQGGYSEKIVVDEDFVLRVPESIPYEKAAPLLCAGITTYSPLNHWNAGPGKKVAVVGLGGLGHMAVKIAHAMGAEVTVLSQTLGKKDDGLKMGADHYYATKDDETFSSLKNTFDLIVNTVSAPAGAQEVPGSARPQRHDGQRRRPAGAAADRGLHAVRQPPLVRGLGHRRHPRDPGDARLLRRARHRARDRAHLGRSDQRGLRARAEERRALPLRHRREDLRPRVITAP